MVLKTYFFFLGIALIIDESKAYRLGPIPQVHPANMLYIILGGTYS
jgi:hypothetical protein